MSPQRTRAQGTGETSGIESMSQGSENPNLTAAQIAQLVATTVEQILANQPESHPPPDQQSDEIRKLQEEIARLREERSSGPPPIPAWEVSFSAEVLAAELPQHFKFPNVGEYDGCWKIRITPPARQRKNRKNMCRETINTMNNSNL
ncbi:hypothetical protein F511_43757 [Dorcoceras hygrometricum]|uniref:Uncharacterized protein n=1 Tax=Dorcoceras hygrometricum TaxID=472368 RepID=A0A2Z6ZYF8_9LAMI|nr:hypothetical protein F511_43757 [Dorcoceras hygrometricum]